MSFQAFFSSDPLLSIALPLLGIIMGVSSFFKVFNMPCSAGKNRFLIFLGVSVLYFLLLIGVNRPIAGLNPQIAAKSAFFLLLCLPLFYFLLIPECINKSKTAYYCVIIALLFVLSGWFIPAHKTIGILLIFIPAWLVALAGTVFMLSSCAQSREESLLLRDILIEVGLGAGILYDFLWIPRYQIFPVFSAIFIIWSLHKLRVYAEKTPQDSWRSMEAADLTAAVLILPVFIIAFNNYAVKIPQNYAYNRTQNNIKIGVILTSIGGTLLFALIYQWILRLYNAADSHIVDGFQKQLNEKTPLNIDDVRRVFEKNFKKLDYTILLRLPCRNEFHPLSGFNSFKEKPLSSSALPDEVFSSLHKEGFYRAFSSDIVHSYVENVFNYEGVSISNRGEVLIIPIHNKTDAAHMQGVWIFYASKSAGFNIHEVKKLFRLTQWASSLMENIRFQLLKNIWKFTDDINNTKDTDLIKNRIEESLCKTLPLAGYALLQRNEEENASEVIIAFNMENKEALKLVSQMFNEKPSDGNFQQPQGVLNEHEPDDVLAVRIPSALGYERFLVMKPDKHKFIVKSDYRLIIEEGIKKMGIVLDGSDLHGELQNRIGEIGSLAEQIEEQKQKFAEELHDTVAQELYAAKLTINLMQKQIKGRMPETPEELEILKETVGSGLEKIRSMINVLRSSQDPLFEEVLKDFEQYIKRSIKETGINIVVENFNHIKLLPYKEACELLAIAREGINNAKKHSKADKIILRFKKQNKTLSLIVADNGIGFNPSNSNSKAGGFGLESMHTRCRRIKGRFKIRSTAGKGAILWVIVNLHY